MTFDPNVPNAAQSPGLFPAQMNTDLARLKTIIQGDHVFNDTAGPTDGVHNQMTMVARAMPATPPGLPAGTSGIMYCWLDANGNAQMRWFNGLTDIQVTPGIVAMVNFDGSGAVGAQTIRSQVNVASVTKTATGTYTVAFTNPMPDTKYVVQVTGHSQTGSGGACNGAIRGDIAYSSAVQTTNVKVQFNGSGSALNDVTGGMVLVTRVS